MDSLSALRRGIWSFRFFHSGLTDIAVSCLFCFFIVSCGGSAGGEGAAVAADSSTSWYVDADADDDHGAGTQADPWKYIPGQNSSLNTEMVSSGDRIYCQRGDVWLEQISVIAGVVYDAYGSASDNPTIDLEAAYGIDNDGFYGYDISSVTVRNFTILGSGEGRGIRFEGDSGSDEGYGIRFEYCTIENDSEEGDDDQHDCVSTDGNAELWLEECTLKECRDPHPGGMHQAVTAHENSKIYMNGGSISNSSVVVQNTGTSEAYLYGVHIEGSIDRVIDSSIDSAAPITFDGCEIDIDSSGHLFGGGGVGGPAQIVTIKNSDISFTGGTDISYLRGGTYVLSNNDIFVDQDDGSPMQSTTASILIFSKNRWEILDSSSSGLFRFENDGDSLSCVGELYTDISDMLFRLSAASATLEISSSILNGSTTALVNVQSGFSGTLTLKNVVAYDAESFVDNGMASDDTGSIEVVGSIFHTVPSAFNLLAAEAKDPLVRYSTFYNSTSYGDVGILSDNPLFLDEGTDFTLDEGSPCRLAFSAGDAELTGFHTGFSGTIRYFDSEDLMNMGAFQDGAEGALP